MSKLSKFLEDYAFSVNLNANDTFAWGCADSETVEIDELPGLIELRDKFGCDGVNAFMAAKRDCDVMNHPQLMTDKYKEAKQYIKDNFISGKERIVPKKFVWEPCYTDKGFVIFSGPKEDVLDNIEE